MPALTTMTGNPANAIADRYQDLMAIQEPAKLTAELRLTVEGTAFSKANRAKFEATLRKIGNDLGKLQSYVTNFILKADGMGVVR